jgi:hypothetical protein
MREARLLVGQNLWPSQLMEHKSYTIDTDLSNLPQAILVDDRPLAIAGPALCPLPCSLGRTQKRPQLIQPRTQATHLVRTRAWSANLRCERVENRTQRLLFGAQRRCTQRGDEQVEMRDEAGEPVRDLRLRMSCPLLARCVRQRVPLRERGQALLELVELLRVRGGSLSLALDALLEVVEASGDDRNEAESKSEMN